MATKEDIKLRVKELRKVERQARLLIRRMRRLENAWDVLRKDLPENTTGTLPQTLGDALCRWNKLDTL